MTTLTEQAETIAQSRYYLKNTEGTIVENDIGLFRRVANAIASVEREYNTLESEIHYMSTQFEAMMAKMNQRFQDSDIAPQKHCKRRTK